MNESALWREAMILRGRLVALEERVTRLEEKVAFWVSYLQQILRELEEAGNESR